MAQVLKLRRSNIQGNIPSVSQIDFGELALNTYDGKIFMRKSGSNGNEVIEIGANDSSQIITGSIVAKVSTNPNSMFLIKSGSIDYLNIKSNSETTLYSNHFIIKNFTTLQAVLTVSESIIKIATQSFNPTGNTEAGAIWFTSSSFYVGLE